MCVRQGLRQTSPQLSPLPSSFAELSCSAPSISPPSAAAVAESAGCVGQYWVGNLAIAWDREVRIHLLSSADWFLVSFPIDPSLWESGEQNAHIKAGFS